ncbi:MAG TPA: transposase [Acidimicrobiales bacterium]|nr:transposase [Acidimicrobiales bacterium]
MSVQLRYSPELRERAVRTVSDEREAHKLEWEAVAAISKLFSMSPETLRTWFRQAQVDGDTRPGLSSDERARLKQLERKVKNLRRTNAILQDASIFFATALDGQTKR